MATLKACLKAAMEAMEAKEYEAVLQHCQAALGHDRKNYNVFLLSGKAAFHLGRHANAEAAYRKGVSLAPDNPAAWKGLLEVFVETNSAEDMESTLVKLQELQPDKAQEYEGRLKDLYCERGDFAKLVDLLKAKEPAGAEGLALQEFYAGVVVALDECQGLWVGRQVEARIATRLEEERLAAMKHNRPLTSDLNVRKALRQELADQVAQGGEVAAVLEEAVARGAAGAEEHLRLLDLRTRGWQRGGPAAGLDREGLASMCLRVIAEHPDAGALPYETVLHLADEDGTLPGLDEDRGLRRLWQRLAHACPGHPMAAVHLACQPRDTADHAPADTVGAVEEALKALSQRTGCIPYLGGMVIAAEQCVRASMFKGCQGWVDRARAEVAARRGRGSRVDDAEFRLDLAVAEMHAHSNRPAQAIAAYEALLGRRAGDHAACKGLARAVFAAGDYGRAAGLCEQIVRNAPEDDEAWAMHGWAAHMAGDTAAGLDRLQKAVELSPGTSLHHYRLAMVCVALGGEHGGRAHAQKHLLLAARLNPNHAPSFTALGHYYRASEKDAERAKRCYQKAVAITAGEDEASAALADLYFDRGQDALVAALCRDVTSRYPQTRWAWRTLGMFELQARNYARAIGAFQHALRTDKKDTLVWEALAEAYYGEGKFSAAGKAAEMALSLGSASHTTHHLLGCVRDTMHDHDGAVESFRAALAASPGFLPALLGGARSLLSSSAQYYHLAAFGESARCVREAYELVGAGLDQGGGKYGCLYKTMGDVCMLMAQMESAPNEESIRALLGVGGAEGLARAVGRAAECYREVLALGEATAAAHYDLGMCLARQAAIQQGLGDPRGAADAMREDGVVHIKRAIAADPQNAVYWNGLGSAVVDPNLQQHAFIRAIEHSPRDATAWANLSRLYSLHGAAENALAAAETGHALDPTNASTRHALALASEFGGSVAEAADAYEYAWELDARSDYKAGAGLMAHIAGRYPAAVRAWRQYVGQRPGCAVGWNMLGLGYEAAGQHNLAETSFRKALEVLEGGPAPPHHAITIDTPYLVTAPAAAAQQQLYVMVNLARCLSHLRRSAEAIELCGQIAALPCDPPTAVQVKIILGKAQIMEGSTAQGVATLEKARDDAASLGGGEAAAAAAQTVLARGLAANEDSLGRSVEAAKRLVDAHPSAPHAHEVLCAVVALSQMWERADWCLQSHAAVAGDTADAARLYEALALGCFAHGRVEEGFGWLDAGIDKCDDTHALCMLRDEYAVLHRPGLVARDPSLSAASARDRPYAAPGVARPARVEAFSLLAHGRASDAAAAMSRWVRMCPWDVEARFFHAMALHSRALCSPEVTEHAAVAARVCGGARGMVEGDDAWAGEMRGLLDLARLDCLLLANGDECFAETKDHAERARGTRWGPLWQRQLGRVHLSAGRTAEGLQCYEEAARDGDLHGLCWKEAAVVLWRRDLASAEMCFTKLCTSLKDEAEREAATPRDRKAYALALMRLSMMYLLWQRYDVACKAIDETVLYSQKNTGDDDALVGVGYLLRGIAYSRVGKWPKAERYLQTAIDKCPDMPLVNVFSAYTKYLSQALQGNECDAESDAYYELDNNPGSPLAKEVLALLAATQDQK